MNYDEAIQKAEAIIAQLESAEALSMEEYKKAAAEATALLKQCKAELEKYVYTIKLINFTVTAPEKTYTKAKFPAGPVWTYNYDNDADDQYPAPVGTGFLTNDGYFITARHVIEPWEYFKLDENSSNPLNVATLYVRLGGTIDATYQIERKDGYRQTLHYREIGRAHV